MKKFFKFIGYSIVRLLLLLWQLPQTLLGIIYLLIFGFIIPKLIIKPYNKLRYLKYKNNIKKGINYHYHNYNMGFQSKTKLRKINPYFIIGTKVDWFAKFFIKFQFLESIPMSKCGYSLVFGSIIINKDFYNNLFQIPILMALANYYLLLTYLTGTPDSYKYFFKSIISNSL